MISTIADLLEAFRRKEVELLDKQKITHSPTIGSMYEGLTRSMLERAVPEGLNLRVVSGFITNDQEELSNQIDCMLVSGQGNQIPHTSEYVYHFRNVIAVVEVKKNLYAKDLDSAYRNLVSTRRLLETGMLEGPLFINAYKAILQSDPYAKAIDDLPLWKRQIGLSLFIDSVTPIRIVLGYHGFANETSLRKSFFSYLERSFIKKGYGVSSLPNLIICGEYSLIKLNYMPYGIPIVDDQEHLYAFFGLPNFAEQSPVKGDLWPVYASYASNPMLLLLEVIWNRLSLTKGVAPPHFSSDLTIELLRPMLLAKALEQADQAGWYYEYFEIPQDALNALPLVTTWQPKEVNAMQAEILTLLGASENQPSVYGDTINLSLLKKAFPGEDETAIRDSVKYLSRAGFISLEDGRLRLLTEECALYFSQDGRIFAGDLTDDWFVHWRAMQRDCAE